jgi:hypothetical protein
MKTRRYCLQQRIGIQRLQKVEGKTNIHSNMITDISWFFFCKAVRQSRIRDLALAFMTPIRQIKIDETCWSVSITVVKSTLMLPVIVFVSLDWTFI